jgi:threonine/homoserine/homoserine lactone efflux protein
MSAQSLIMGLNSGSSLFFASAAVGFAAAVPLGPISILTVQRAMTLGFWRAFWPTLGAVGADGLLGVVAAVGSGFITAFILGNSFWFKLFGCMLLLAMGSKLLILRPMNRTVPEESFDSRHLTAMNFILVLSNPLTLAFFMAAFTFMGFNPGPPVLFQSLVVGAGVTFGTVIWFALICFAAGLLHRKVGDVFLNRVRAGVGGIFVVIAVLSAASVLVAG